MNLKSIIKKIKDAGFGYIKVELEAQINRPYEDDYAYETCDCCDGDGRIDCEQCSGNGYVETEVEDENGTVIEEEEYCDACEGDGTVYCEACDGSGEISVNDSEDFSDVDDCKRFIEESISKEAKDSIIFGKFYNDGSVDSEYTFTISVDNIEYLPEFIDSFNKLAEAVGNPLDVDGAGMHIAVLPTESQGAYAGSGRGCSAYKTFGDKNIANFYREVGKLLPALFVAATSGNFTRELGYRYPKIDSDKYSAIHVIANSCIEYRLFETCYQRPLAVFEYLGTIAKTLEYLKDPSKKVESIGKEYSFYDNEGMDGLIKTPEQVQIIKKHLRKVVPDGMTINKFLEHRDINLSVTSRKVQVKTELQRVKKLYKQTVETYKQMLEAPLTEWQTELFNRYMTDPYNRGMSENEIIIQVKGLRNPGTEEQFIKEHIYGMYANATVSV